MILDQIEQDFKNALRQKNIVAKSSLGNLKAALQNAELEKRSGLSDEEVLKVVAKKVKQHKDSITQFEAGKRMDLSEKEKDEMAVLEKYLPQKIGEEKIRVIVKETISKLKAGPQDFGLVMKEAIKKLSGQAEGAEVSKIVKEELK